MGNLSFRYPFSAIVGQERLKRALIISAINPATGGLLVRGERGTAKSTAARALASLLPDIEVVKGCQFSCHPQDIGQMCAACYAQAASGDDLPSEVRKADMVTLPLNATEDKVAGTINVELVLRTGEVHFEPGVLAKANRGILYIDEVNLLEDHLVDLLLDAAAMGVNLVEREGISHQHPARFVIVATMNPEEGELRPQLEDRFGLCVDVRGERDPARRMEILRRRRRFGENPLLFASEWQTAEDYLRQDIERARERLEHIGLDDSMLALIAGICVEMDAGGHRADIAIMHAATALAALDGHARVGVEHIREAAELALRHRCERRGETEGLGRRIVDALQALAEPGSRSSQPEKPMPSPPTEPAKVSVQARSDLTGGHSEATQEHEVAPRERETAQPEPPHLSPPAPALPRPTRAGRAEVLPGGGKRHEVQAASGTGRYVSARAPQGEVATFTDIALDATVRAAAIRAPGAGQPSIAPQDVRVRVRKQRAGSLILFVLDASASMHARASLASAKAVILDLLTEAYQKRDRVGLIIFKDDRARLALAPTSSISLARMNLDNLTPGGSTPLCHGLALGHDVIARELKRNPSLFPIMVVITDGNGNVGMRSDDPLGESLRLGRELRAARVNSLVIDTGSVSPDSPDGSPRISAARRVADAMAADYFAVRRLDEQVLMERVSPKLG